MRRETADYLPFHTDCYTTVVRKLLPPIEKNYVQKRRDRRPRLSVCFVGFFRVVEGADPYGEEKKPKKANRGVVLLIPCRDRRPRRSVYLVVFFGSSKAPTPTGTRKFQNFTKREDTILPYGGWGFILAFVLSIVPSFRLILPFERTRGLNLSQNSPSRIPIQNHPKAVVDAFG